MDPDSDAGLFHTLDPFLTAASLLLARDDRTGERAALLISLHSSSVRLGPNRRALSLPCVTNAAYHAAQDGTDEQIELMDG